MDCQWTGGVCVNCGRKLPAWASDSLHATCSADPRNAKMPSAPKRVWNLAKALVDFVADGCKTVTRAEYEARLRVCDSCELRSGVWCRHPDCGCNREIKAHGRAWKCPVGKWVEASGVVSSDTSRP